MHPSVVRGFACMEANMEKSQSARDRERWRLIRRLNELDENENWPSGPDGRPLRPVPFPRPYMMAQGISEKLRIDPERPGLNPLCRCLNALWDDVNWELNIALHNTDWGRNLRNRLLGQQGQPVEEKGRPLPGHHGTKEAAADLLVAAGKNLMISRKYNGWVHNLPIKSQGYWQLLISLICHY